MITQNLAQITSKDQLDNLLKGTPVVIVDFYADWCPPCRAIAPKFEALANDPTMARVKFCKLNIDTLPNVGAIYSIRSIPTFIIFFKGKEVDRMVSAGIIDIKNTLLRQLEKVE